MPGVKFNALNVLSRLTLTFNEHRCFGLRIMITGVCGLHIKIFSKASWTNVHTHVQKI